MRSYESNSPEAVGRLLALTIISDGCASPSEMSAMHASRVLEQVDLQETAFKAILENLCNDLLATSGGGIVKLEPELIDRLLLEIDDAALRRTLFQAMWRIADADDWLADGEAVLLCRAASVWGAENNFVSRREAFA